MGADRRSTMKYLALIILITFTVPAPAYTQLKRLDISIGLRETQSNNISSITYNWALDGLYEQPLGDFMASLTVDSDYTGGDANLDVLRTWWRIMPQQKSNWVPVLLVSTEGDHSLERLSVLTAIGMQRKINGGFVEFSAGTSKDVRLSESWKADFGVLLDYRRKWGRFGIGIKPHGILSTTDELRIRDGEWRYSVDFNANYAIDSHIGIGYRMLRSNLSGVTNGDQFIGLTYHH